MFKKSKRAFRQTRQRRPSDSSDDDSNSKNLIDSNETNEESLPKIEQDDDNSNSNASFTKTSSNNNTNNAQKTIEKKSKLSFLDNEDDNDSEDVFVVKKSVYSRRMEKNKRKLLKSKSKVNDSTSNNEHSNDLNDSTKNDTKSNKETNENEPDEIIICPDSDDNDTNDNDDIKSLRGPQFSQPSFQRGMIPDAKTIYELKKRRQKMAMTADFISLENQNDDDDDEIITKNKSKNSDDDNDDENSDSDDHVEFGNVNYESKEKEKFREQFRNAQEEKDVKIDDQRTNQDESSSSSSSSECSDRDVQNQDNDTDDDDDKLDKWELEQMRKAVRMPNIYKLAQTELMASKYLTKMDMDNALINKLQILHDNHSIVPIEIDDDDDDDNNNKQQCNKFGSYLPDFIKNANNDSSKIDSFHDRLITRRKQTEAKLNDKKNFHNRLEMDINLMTNDINEYESDVNSLKNEYLLYHSMNDYVNSLFDCINDKMNDLTTYEENVLKIFEKYEEKILQKYSLKIQDQNSIILFLIQNHQQLMMQQPNNLIGDNFCILNVYNFNNDELKRKRCHEYLANNQNNIDQNDTILLKEELESIRRKTVDLFDDTDDNFASINGICRKFSEWKSQQCETYEESFISEFIVKFLSYYLRYDFIFWNIFDDHNHDGNNSIDLIENKSIQNLINYCFTNDKIIDTDLNLIPKLIDQVILKKLIHMIDMNLWDPLSTKKTEKLATFLHRTIENFPTIIDCGENFLKLLSTIVKRFQKTIDDDLFIPQMIPTEFFHTQKSSSLYENLAKKYIVDFFHQQYNEIIKLMQNILLFREILNETILIELTLDRLCFRFIFISILRSFNHENNNDHNTINTITTIERLNELFETIPKEWFNKEHKLKINLEKFNQFLQQLLDRSVKFSNSGDILKDKILSILYQINLK